METGSGHQRVGEAETLTSPFTSSLIYYLFLLSCLRIEGFKSCTISIHVVIDLYIGLSCTIHATSGLYTKKSSLDIYIKRGKYSFLK